MKCDINNNIINIYNQLIANQEEEYKNKIKELEKKIKEFELKIKEKDIIIEQEKKKNESINKKIKELENISNNNSKIYKNNILKLNNEIKLFRKFNNFSEEEKLISIRFTSVAQDIDFSIVTKNTEIFTRIEIMLYNKYPKYIESENYFLVNGNKVNKHKTFEQNNIKNDDIITLQINNFD